MKHLFICFVFALIICSPLSAAILVDEKFADNERSNQSLNYPLESLQWTLGAHNSNPANSFATLNASSGQLVLDHTISPTVPSFAGTWAYFSPAGVPVTLANVGDSLKLTFDVTLTNGTFTNNAQAFRFGLLNSNNSRVTTDFIGTSEAGLSSGTSFSTWRGYEFNTNVVATNSGSDNAQIRERTGTGNGLNTASNWTILSINNNSPVFSLNQTGNGTLNLLRTAQGIEITSTVNGITNSVTDTTDFVSSFDTISFFTTNTENYDLVFDNLRVEFNAVPEPTSTITAFTVICGLTIMLKRRLELRNISR